MLILFKKKVSKLLEMSSALFSMMTISGRTAGTLAIDPVLSISATTTLVVANGAIAGTLETNPTLALSATTTSWPVLAATT